MSNNVMYDNCVCMNFYIPFFSYNKKIVPYFLNKHKKNGVSNF